MAKFRKKLVDIEAVRWSGNNMTEMGRFIGTDINRYPGDKDLSLTIATPEGNMKVMPGDWVVKVIKSEFHTYKPDVFEATYEPIED